MNRPSACFSICAGLVLAACLLSARAQAFGPTGNLDCNGYSKIQTPLRPQMTCADFIIDYDHRGFDNGHYVGHDEPSVGFFSALPHSGNSVQWDITLPVERPLPATQTFENMIAFWFAMAVCDVNSYPQGPCIPDSDENTPSQSGSAFVELQFYPPGFPPFITQISCDLTHWCAALNIDSLEATSGFNFINPNCPEPVNFAWIQRDGKPTGPPGPTTATAATLTPNSHTLLMNQGDHLRITLTDTASGLLARVEDLTTGQTGYMVASGANGFQNTDLNTCAGTNYDFHPEYDTARYGNFVPWAALQANINVAVEIGHFTPGAKGDGDSDDGPCFPGPTVAGCLNLAEGGDIDFDGTSYLADWPDGTRHNATSFAIRSVRGGGVGPLSKSDDGGGYVQPFPIMQIETDVSASEQSCQPNGVGCDVPPQGAKFYPYYSFTGNGDYSFASSNGDCSILFGNNRGHGINDFGGAKQYGAPNLSWFFGQNTNGPQANPCIPHTGY
jgi:hypothetical protein